MSDTHNTSRGSVTTWLRLLQSGELEAAQPLWDRYSRRLVRMARTRLAGLSEGFADEEDVVLDAFDSFFRGVRRGRFPDLRDRDNLWRLLVVITLRKAAHLRLHERRLKRAAPASPAALPGSEEDLLATEPTPELAAQLTQTCERLLATLADSGLSTIALWKMEGYTNDEIADRLGCAQRTVERKLGIIRHTWLQASET